MSEKLSVFAILIQGREIPLARRVEDQIEASVEAIIAIERKALGTGTRDAPFRNPVE